MTARTSMGGVTPTRERTIERVMRRKSEGGGGGGGGAGWMDGRDGRRGRGDARSQPAEIFTSGLRRILSWSYTTKAMAMLGMILT